MKKLLMDIGEHFPFCYTVVECLDNGYRECIYVNSIFTDVTGYEASEAIGKNLSFLQGPLTAKDSVDHMREALSNYRSCIQDVVNYKKDGTPFLNRLLILPISSKDGLFFVSIQYDITEKKGVAYHNDSLKKVTDSEIKHSVKNLLTIILNCHAQLLKESSSLDERRRIHNVLADAFFRINNYCINIESLSDFENFDYLKAEKAKY